LCIYWFATEAVPRAGLWKSFSPVVLFSDALNFPCDVPLKPWSIGLATLQLYSCTALCLCPCSLHHLLAMTLCCWNPAATTRTLTMQLGTRQIEMLHVMRPVRVSLLDVGVIAVDICWVLLGLRCILLAKDCNKTAPELFYSSKVIVTACLTLVTTWTFCVVPAFVVKFGARAGYFHMQAEARHGCLEAQQVVPFDPAVFNGDIAPCDCYVCLDDFGPEEDIRQTTCGHYFHGACLGRWLQQSTGCPVCRADLSAPPVREPSIGRGTGGNSASGEDGTAGTVIGRLSAEPQLAVAVDTVDQQESASDSAPLESAPGG